MEIEDTYGVSNNSLSYTFLIFNYFSGRTETFFREYSISIGKLRSYKRDRRERKRMEKQCVLAFGRDRRGRPALVKLPEGVCQPGAVVRLANGFMTVTEQVTVAEGGKAYAMFAAGYPILAAEEVLRPVWRRERG